MGNILVHMIFLLTYLSLSQIPAAFLPDFMQYNFGSPGSQGHLIQDFFSLPDMKYLSPLICAVFIVMIPLWVAIAKQSPSLAEVLKSGWQPVIVAMSISR